jgi:hypothetical protein
MRRCASGREKCSSGPWSGEVERVETGSSWHQASPWMSTAAFSRMGCRSEFASVFAFGFLGSPLPGALWARSVRLGMRGIVFELKDSFCLERPYEFFRNGVGAE